jgi:ATP-dependent DNA helicase RecQ
LNFCSLPVAVRTSPSRSCRPRRPARRRRGGASDDRDGDGGGPGAGVPPYLIFSDASLRDMARARPSTLDEFREVKGVGDWKLETFGDRFVTAVRQAAASG